MTKRIFCLFLALLTTCCAFSGCQREKTDPEISLFLMDTVITVRLYTDEETAAPILERCRALLEEADALWSKEADGSDVKKINLSADGAEVDPRTAALLRTALEISEKTGGAFDVTVAPLCDLWKQCGGENRLPDGAEISGLLSKVGKNELTVSENRVWKSDAGVKIDLGGIGKGAAISSLAGYLKSTGIAGGLVSFGSNVAVIGAKPDGTAHRIGLRDPSDASGILGVLSLTDGQILSVTGDYERFVEIGGERYHHVIDPKTGYPSDSGLSQAAVICADGATADALSTALFVLGADAAMELYASGVLEFEAIFVSHDGEITKTPGMDAIFAAV